MSFNEKLTIISFDETYISKRICYDKKNEQMLGPHTCVQTVVVRGNNVYSRLVPGTSFAVLHEWPGLIG